MDGEDERRDWEIPELICSIRSSFLKSDFERVQAILVSREAKKDLQIESLAEQLQSSEAAIAESEARCANLEAEMGILRRRCADVEAEGSSARAKAVGLDARVAELEARMLRLGDENSILKGSHQRGKSAKVGVMEGNNSLAIEKTQHLGRPEGTYDGASYANATGCVKPMTELVISIDDDDDNETSYNSTKAGDVNSGEDVVILDDMVKVVENKKKSGSQKKLKSLSDIFDDFNSSRGFLSVPTPKRKSASVITISDSDADVTIAEMKRKQQQKTISFKH
ncbi:hypothetical protein QJS10_CPA01g02192 [Acorus calamus]|uniref:Uncharacterized protein n=1 Tax=Acorus calamus TaxID=4465 RepID=A0AAV9FJ12_ACOCL|nr:hypothetical protein QJS10_CPA01g02192 [Acorus calamus]